MRAPDDPYPDALARVIRARIEGDDTAALTEIAKIRFEPPGRKKEQWPALSVIARVYLVIIISVDTAANASF